MQWNTHNIWPVINQKGGTIKKIIKTCVGRESNPDQLLGRQLCSPLYHRRSDGITLKSYAKNSRSWQCSLETTQRTLWRQTPTLLSCEIQYHMKSHSCNTKPPYSLILYIWAVVFIQHTCSISRHGFKTLVLQVAVSDSCAIPQNTGICRISRQFSRNATV